MHDAEQLWVLGHRVRPLATDATYGLIEVTSLPKIPGPPPHYHEHEREFFMIQRGTLDVMENGHWQRMGPGSFVELAPGTVHTFINNTDEPVVWITGWRPKGFEQFFRDFGVPLGEQGAQARSVSIPIVEQVVAKCGSYGMIVAGGT
jgi:quercetin dioxygenase-like cupin family protein